MKAQSKLAAFWESWQSTLIGFVIALVLAIYVLPICQRLFPGKPGATLFTLIMTVVSLVRQWGVRVWKEHQRNKNVPPDFAYVIEEVADERVRQISGEGYSLAHDDEQDEGQIASGAAAYCLASVNRVDGIAAVQIVANALPGTRVDAIRKAWVRGINSFKPTTPRRNLIKAAAMIVAEIGRIDRSRRRTGFKASDWKE